MANKKKTLPLRFEDAITIEEVAKHVYVNLDILQKKPFEKLFEFHTNKNGNDIAVAEYFWPKTIKFGRLRFDFHGVIIEQTKHDRATVTVIYDTTMPMSVLQLLLFFAGLSAGFVPGIILYAIFKASKHDIEIATQPVLADFREKIEIY